MVRRYVRLFLVPVVVILFAACSSASPEVTEVTRMVTETIVETRIVEGTPQIVEVEVTRIVPAEAPEEPEAESEEAVQRIVFADGNEPIGLYPPTATSPPGTIQYLLYDTLIGHDENMNPDPSRGLATSWEVGEDQLTWTIRLREGVKFHDGTDFDAEAVKVNIETILDPDTAASRRSNFAVITAVNVVDPLTVELVTERPYPYLPNLLTDRSAMMVSPTALQERGVEGVSRDPVGTGPYTFVEWVPNDHITFKANPDYWGGAPRVSEIVFRQVPEDSARTAMLHTGEVDIALNLPPADLNSLEANPEVNVIRTDSLTVVHSEMKQTQPPFSIPEVRLAMNLAVDKEAIVNNIMNGAGSVPQSPAAPSMYGYVAMDPFPYDPERARELLAEAGYPDGFEGTLWFIPGRWGGDTQVAEALQAYWRAVGLEIEILRTDQAGNDEIVLTDPDEVPGYTSLQLRTSPYMHFHLHRLYHSTSSDTGYSNPRVDELLDQAASTFDLDEQAALFEEIQRLIWEDAPFIELFVRQNLAGVREGISGYVFYPIGDLLLTEVQRAQ